MDLDTLLAQRLATQHLASTPVGVLDVVRHAVAVQSQDAPLARWSIGLRSGRNDDAVRAAIDAGDLLRTHVLRPTWHYVLPEDLRWLLELSRDRIERSMGARHRQLGITEHVVERSFAVLADALAGGRTLTRKQLHPLLPTTAFPAQGQVVAHLLMLAEVRALVCSGPLEKGEHTYGLVDDRVPPSPVRPREELVRDLAARFFAGHGPSTPADLARWAAVTRTEVRKVLPDLDLSCATVEGTEVWWDPRAVPEQRRDDDPRAFLLSTFDEACLTYLPPSYPRLAGHPWGDRPPTYAQVGGGPVICDLREVGVWRRRTGRTTTRVELDLSPAVTGDQHAAIRTAAERLAAFEGRGLELAG
ncbi:Winged helix DNA-binding domain-containing protein [Raineyella antarctica]|uniref:Winged helix DNA-binding domain-containing protein n=1 Tax=Raineyella antarctica TaxID=1577474 RepID=A0A1G6H6N2_9ACTN|nr:winged helix DNA-binding domain-containing protein [Raineyella antarctica]SDB89891.1 Winged helix DNA-binding domain-containing protein [Raineyella antarctica]